MKKNDCEVISVLSNNKSSMDALYHYTDLRIESLRESLVTLLDLDQIRKTQGAIEELRRMKHLRDEVNNPKD